MVTWHQWLGMLGTSTIVLAFLLIQIGRLTADRLSYSLLNAVGAGLVIVSLSFEFNLAAFVLEIFWAAISVVGIVRCLRQGSMGTA